MEFDWILPLFEISTAQRVLSFAIGCFIRSLITIGKLLFVRFELAVWYGLGNLNEIFFNWTVRGRGGVTIGCCCCCWDERIGLRTGLVSKKKIRII